MSEVINILHEVVHPRLLRLHEVERRVGLKKSSIYQLEAQGEFPQRVPITGKASGWVESEISDWVEDRISLRTGST